ncbi:hypothetical protein [Streptomyces beijiangensis]|uniref:Uncharacterized protein n=1 Tax=Streptomyces beijiangensis TaxID=163361 RepID=A0A939FDR9_9ACTN|nr:hypothetical protein [Streptomyces beijiangensis]MBO0515532.1 hypothetical protein [Streptomyces beijiangensis]
MHGTDVVREGITRGIREPLASLDRQSGTVQRILCRRVGVQKLHAGLLALPLNPTVLLYVCLPLHLRQRRFDCLRPTDTRPADASHGSDRRADQRAARPDNSGDYPSSSLIHTLIIPLQQLIWSAFTPKCLLITELHHSDCGAY